MHYLFSFFFFYFLQYWILFSPPDISKTEHHFSFHSAASFFLQLLFIACALSQQNIGHLQNWKLIFWCHIFLPLCTDSLLTHSVKNSSLQCRIPQFDSWVGKIPWRRDRLAIPVFLAFPCGSDGKESTYNMVGLGWITGFGKSPGEGKGYPLQSGLENSMDFTVHGSSKSWTQLSDFHFHFSLFMWF